MTGKEFLRAVSNGETDVLQLLLAVLKETDTAYCIIGGLAVNAYAEPVVSLDLDVVVVAENVAKVSHAAQAKGFRVQSFEHSVNLSLTRSDLRIQLQTDGRYQDFLARAEKHTILGYELSVASVEDVLQGKIWAYLDEARRKSKRQKDLADVFRLVEAQPALKARLPAEILARLE